MTNFVTLQNELRTNLTLDINFVNNMFQMADDMLKFMTRRNQFTGFIANTAARAKLCIVIDMLIFSDYKILGSAVKEIFEDNTRLIFGDGKNLDSYQLEAQRLIGMMALPERLYPSQNTFTLTSISPEYTEDDRTFYRVCNNWTSVVGRYKLIG